MKRVDDRIKIDLSATQKALLPLNAFSQALNLLLNDDLMENLPIDYAAVACDLITGKKVVLTQGTLITAVLASGSIPGILPPVPYQNWILTDGEASDIVPVATAKELGAGFTIAFDVSQNFITHPSLENTLEIVNRVAQIKSYELKKLKMAAADFIITPDVGRFHWSEFRAYEDILQAGYLAGKQALSGLNNII